MNLQYCPACKKQYEYWEQDKNADYTCGECGKLICINGKHTYLYCSRECADKLYKE